MGCEQLTSVTLLSASPSMWRHLHFLCMAYFDNSMWLFSLEYSFYQQLVCFQFACNSPYLLQ